MAIKRLFTSVKFATLQWGDVLRCAVSSDHDFRSASVDVDQLEARVLFSASPLPVEAVDAAEVDVVEVDEADTADASSATSQDGDQSDGGDTTPDDIRTSDDSLALLDELTNELLQFTTNGGNVLGFTQDSILVASSSNLFNVQFVGANLVGPVATDSASNATEVAASAPVGAAAFTGVTYAGLWDGVTAVFDSQEGAILKSTYYVDAGLGGSPVDQIRLQYNRDVSLDAQGNLVISYDTGTMTDSAPVAWQDIDGQRIFVDVHYALLGGNQVGFTVGNYDYNYQLVIDPTLTWNTFLGGSGTDVANAIAVDASGNVYAAGSSTQSWGSPVQSYSSGTDAFVTKIAVAGVAFDAASSGTALNATGLTFSHTVSGNNRLLLVGVATEPNGSEGVSSITYNGVNLTFVGSRLHASDNVRVEIWSLVAPATGTHNVVVTLSAQSKGIVAGATSFNGVDQSTPLGAFASAAGDSSAASVNVASAANDLVFGFVGVRKGVDATPGTGQTERTDDKSGNIEGASSTENGAASVVTSWSLDRSDKWIASGVSIKALLNSAPVLDPSKSPVMVAQTEDSGVPSGVVGTLVSSLVDFAVPAGQVDNVTDSDFGAQLGIAVTSTNSTFTQADIDAGIITYLHNDTETASDSFSFTVDDGTGATSGGDFNITVTPVNDNAPIITSNAGGATANISVPENSTTVTTVIATDADLPSQTLSYSIVGGADAALFSLNSSTGVLTFVSARDRENPTDANSNGIYEVIVQAADGALVDTQSISVTVIDVNEFAVTSPTDINAAGNAVAENATNGSLVGITASAADADATNNTITYSLFDNASGRFAIHATTGVVTVNGALDYETATSHNITARATSSDGSFSTQSFTINVTDVNESGVSAIGDSDAATDFVLENATPGTVVGLTAFATDADGTDTVSYSLDDSAGGRFAIDATTGIVTVNGAIDREAASSYNITVRATSTDTTTITRVFNIAVGDIDEFDVGTVSDSNASANSVAEDATLGTVVGITVAANDADATNNTITYTLDDNAGGLFAIDANTGIVSVAGALDYETATTHNITTRATSSDGSFSTLAFTISVTDVNEFTVSVISDSDGSVNAVAEDATNGDLVGLTALASDADGTNNAITYSLDDDASGRFAIDSSTGIVTLADSSLLDFETAASHNIIVRASSSDGSFQTRGFAISVIDKNDAPIITSHGGGSIAFINVAEGSTFVATVVAQDADLPRDVLAFSIIGGADAEWFDIDSNSGHLRFKQAPNFEVPQDANRDGIHDIIVRVADGRGGIDQQTIQVTVTKATGDTARSWVVRNQPPSSSIPNSYETQTLV